MRIDILSPLPHLLKAPFTTSILAKAIEKKIVEILVHDLRDYAKNNKKQIDDYSYGGGGGMVLMIEPIANCIQYPQECAQPWANTNVPIVENRFEQAEIIIDGPIFCTDCGLDHAGKDQFYGYKLFTFSI